jgi:hypothetical protein
LEGKYVLGKFTWAKLGIAFGTAGLVLSLPATALASPLAPAGEHCDPATTVKYRQVQWEWKSYDHGEINNASRAGTASQTYTYSRTFTLSSTIEAGAEVKIGTALVGASSSLHISVTGSASFTKGHSFTVSAGPHEDVQWRNGVIQRDIQVTKHVLYSNCDNKNSSGYLHAADNYLQVKDV